MVSKKGEGVRGVLGDLVSRREQPQPPASAVKLPPQTVDANDDPLPIATEATHNHVETPPAVVERSTKKAMGIKGRPRVKKDKDATPQAEKTKVTLSIETSLRDQFYLLAHGEMMQPGEYVERALRHYIRHHPKRG